MRFDSARADDELFGNLRIGQPQRHQLQDLKLAGSETEEIRPGCACLGDGRGSEYGLRRLRWRDLLSHLDRGCYRLLQRHCLPFCPGLCESHLVQLGMHSSHGVFMGGMLASWQGSAHRDAQGLCCSKKLRCTPGLSPDSGYSCQPFQDCNDPFLLSRLLSQDEAFLIAPCCPLNVTLLQRQPPQDGECMGAPCFMSKLLPDH
jgi:hypothetical protein